MTVISKEALQEENALLKRYICNAEIITHWAQYRGQVWQRAYDDQAELLHRVIDIITDNERLDLWDHLYQEEKS